jgi:membrane-bound serine protease (ClpP class)
MRQRIARSQIKSIERQPREGPAYCPLPIVGVIGEDVLARDLDMAIEQALRSNPKYIVLVIDSPGGVIGEMSRIVTVIAEHPDVKFIAYIKDRAISAAAIIALACPEIYMAPEASIGACVPYAIGPDGTPVAVEAKWESAIHARMRAAAQLGGHDELWVRGMTELDAEIAAAPGADGRLGLKMKADAPPDARMVKRKGQIMTVTGAEAAELRLAAGVADQLDNVKLLLGHKAWHVSDDLAAWQLMESRGRAARAELTRQEAQTQKQLAQRRFLQSVTPEIHRLDDQIGRSLARGVAAKDALEATHKEFNEKLAALEAEREYAVRMAPGSANANTAAARANDSFRARRKELIEQYRPQANELAQRVREATAEAQIMLERRKILLAGASGD